MSWVYQNVYCNKGCIGFNLIGITQDGFRFEIIVSTEWNKVLSHKEQLEI